MGYTNYWTKDNGNFDSKGFKKALPILKQILDKYSDLICYEEDYENLQPVLTPYEIRFNGKGKDAHETFHVSGDGQRDFNFCKTARKPYDIVVCEVLLVLRAYMEGFHISSDGFDAKPDDLYGTMDCNWSEAIANVKESYGVFTKLYPQNPCGIDRVNVKAHCYSKSLQSEKPLRYRAWSGLKTISDIMGIKDQKTFKNTTYRLNCILKKAFINGLHVMCENTEEEITVWVDNHSKSPFSCKSIKVNL